MNVETLQAYQRIFKSRQFAGTFCYIIHNSPLPILSYLIVPKDLAMKYTWLLILLFVQKVHAQSTGDAAGEDVNNYNNVSGDPFLFKDWCEGVIKFTSGRVVTQFKLK